MSKVEKYLNEGVPYVGEVSDHIKGIKRWLDDLEATYAYQGNIKDVHKIMNNIVKAIDKLKKSLKNV